MASMSMVGTTGLVCIPTAQVMPNGEIALGMAYTDPKYSYHGPESFQIVYCASVGYLPFLELGFRITQFPGFLEPKAYGSAKDRMFSAKLRIINESRYLPSLVLGVHDLYGHAVNFNAQYAVISKSIKVPLVGKAGFHIGYSPNPIKHHEINNYSMEGAFAGIEKALCKYVILMLEYDTQKYNLGLRIEPFDDKIHIDVSMLGLSRISGGMNISFGL